MTPDQRKMARHALGLPNDRKLSYRNRYVASIGSDAEERWDDLVRQGLAERREQGNTMMGFWLTEIGAKLALEPGEGLDLEDFPLTRG